MKTNDNPRVEARARAGRRLRAMTIATAVLGVAATGTLGWMAAATTVAGASPPSTGVAVTNPFQGGGSTSTAPTVTRGTRRSQVTTGGSGLP